jgi:hypothetical protein
MEKNPDEVPVFTRFVGHGLALPASNFFKGLLKYYGIEYLNLNPVDVKSAPHAKHIARRIS